MTTISRGQVEQWRWLVKGSQTSRGWTMYLSTRCFGAKFNSTVPGAYRNITANDIRLMTYCGLIGRHGFFEREDLELVRGILRCDW
jgi:hypothetical protein